MKRHKHGTVMKCYCVVGVSHCLQGAKLKSKVDKAKDDKARAEALSAYNKHFGYEDEPTTESIRGGFYQNGIITEHGFDMLKEVRETLEIAMWNEGAAIAYIAWNYSITEPQAIDVVMWALNIMTEQKEQKDVIKDMLTKEEIAYLKYGAKMVKGLQGASTLLKLSGQTPSALVIDEFLAEMEASI